MSTIAYEEKDHVATLTIKSPPANALSSMLLKELSECFDEIETNRTAKVVILKGEGNYFSAGADIKELASIQNESDYQLISEKGQQLFNRIEQFSIPVIAAIHGAALGGGLELAMACHMRIVTEQAKLGMPELTLGIIPGFAGTQRLPQYVGSAKAYELLLSGELVSGTDAHLLGLANRVVSEENLFNEVAKLTEQITTKSMQSINRIMDLIPYAQSNQFTEGSHAEAKAFAEIFGSVDAIEGIQAFMEKRKPNFNNR